MPKSAIYNFIFSVMKRKYVCVVRQYLSALKKASTKQPLHYDISSLPAVLLQSDMLLIRQFEHVCKGSDG